MPQVFKSIALVGNAKDLRVAECMLGLAAHFQARGMPVLVDPSVGLAFKAGSVVLCPEQSFANRADLIVAILGTLLWLAMGGISETTTIMDQKYVGSCPAGTKPGDRIAADGRITHSGKSY